MVLAVFHPPISDDDPLSNNDEDENKEIVLDVSKDVKYSIIIAYVLLIIIWILLIYFLGIAPWTMSGKTHFTTGISGWITFFVPIVMIGITIIAATKSDDICSLKQSLSSTNVLTIVILLVIPILSILDLNYRGDRQNFMSVILASMTLAILTNIDLYAIDSWACLLDHIKSGMRTISLGLLLYVVLLYSRNGKYFAVPKYQGSDAAMVKVL